MKRGAESEPWQARREVLAGVAAVCAGVVVPAEVPAAAPGGEEKSRRERGLAVLGLVAGGDAMRALGSVEKAAPDLARMTVEFAFGEVIGRPGLALAERELCTVAMLMALGDARPQLQFHMAGFLNVGGLPEHLLELVILSAPVLGFPAAIDAIGAVRSLFAGRAVTARAAPAPAEDPLERGRRTASDLQMELSSRHPDLARWQISFQFGEVMARQGLSPRLSALVCAAMVAAGGRSGALKGQIRSALRLGVSQMELAEVFTQAAVYAGFPAAVNAANALSEVLEEPPQTLPRLPEVSEPETTAQRRERGLAAMARTSATAGEAVVRSFDDLAPDLGRLIVEHSYGDVFSRPGLDPRIRELCAVACLAASGAPMAATPLKVHIRAAARAGAARGEIEEALLNLEPYLGFARTANALKALEEIGDLP